MSKEAAPAGGRRRGRGVRPDLEARRSRVKGGRPVRDGPHVVVVGAGSTGAAVAHDLALRGFQVTVVERGEVGSGTTGRNHGLLHSGARYAVTDPAAARECIEENRILRKIMPEGLELNGGYFLALAPEDMDFRRDFLEGCEAAGIPTREIPPDQLRRMEPRLSPKILGGVLVPDGVFEPYRFCLSFLASAQARGARVLAYHEVEGILVETGRAKGVRVRDRIRGRELTLRADAVINAGGPWAAKIAATAGCRVPLTLAPGVMVAVGTRFSHRVVNRLAPPGDGDIIVPQRFSSVVGTTSWTVEDADFIPIPPDHVERMLEAGEAFFPGFRRQPLRGVFAVARPLATPEGVELDGGDGSERALSRDFACKHHEQEGAAGLFSVTGGKTTTARLMAEAVVDQVGRWLGFERPCQTRTEVLLPPRRFFAERVVS